MTDTPTTPQVLQYPSRSSENKDTYPQVLPERSTLDLRAQCYNIVNGSGEAVETSV